MDDTSQALLVAAAVYREAVLDYEAAAVKHEFWLEPIDLARSHGFSAREAQAAAELELLTLCMDAGGKSPCP